MIFLLHIYIYIYIYIYHFLILRNQKTFWVFLGFYYKTHTHIQHCGLLLLLLLWHLKEMGSDEKDTLDMSFAVNVGIQDPAPNGSYCWDYTCTYCFMMTLQSWLLSYITLFLLLFQYRASFLCTSKSHTYTMTELSGGR